MYATVSIRDTETVRSNEAHLQKSPARNSFAGTGVNLSSTVRFPLYGRVTVPRFDILPLEDSTERRLFETSHRSHEIESCQFFLPSVYGVGNCLFQVASISITGSSDEHWRTLQVGCSLQMNCNSRLVTSLRYWQGVLNKVCVKVACVPVQCC